MIGLDRHVPDERIVLTGPAEEKSETRSPPRHFAWVGVRASTREQARRGKHRRALAAGLPDVFQAEILPRLELEDVLSLSRVNKTCWKAVWSEPGVRTLKAKLDSHLAKRTRDYWRSCIRNGPVFPPELSPIKLRRMVRREQQELQESWKKCIRIKIDMVVWRNKQGHPPMVETLRRWERNGGPGPSSGFSCPTGSNFPPCARA